MFRGRRLFGVQMPTLVQRRLQQPCQFHDGGRNWLVLNRAQQVCDAVHKVSAVGRGRDQFV